MKKHKRGITQVQGIIQEKPNNKNKNKKGKEEKSERQQNSFFDKFNF